MAKKLTLKIEELAVESFQTDQWVLQAGTVHGHETMWADSCGLCESGNSCGELSGCDACFPTNGCTNDPGQAECYDSYNFCFMTHAHCCNSQSGNPGCPGASGMEFC